MLTSIKTDDGGFWGWRAELEDKGALGRRQDMFEVGEINSSVLSYNILATVIPMCCALKNLRNKVIAAITSECWDATQDKDDWLPVEGMW